MPPKCFETSRTERARRSGRWCWRSRRRVAVGQVTVDVHHGGGIGGELHRRRALEEHRAEHVGPVEQLAGGAVEADLALLHEVRGVGHGERHVHRLLDQDHRGALLLEPLHGLEELGHHARGQAERQLVDHQQPGPRQQRHRDGEHLLLPAAEVGRRLLHAVLERRELLQGARRGLRRGSSRRGRASPPGAGSPRR